jgi:hypothetical protein
MLVEQHLRLGMAPAAARREALRVFGTLEGVKDDVRDHWLSRFFEMAAQDVRYGVRSLRRNTGFALVIIVTMALGIGANTAIFSVVNGVLLRPLPYRDGDKIVVLHHGQGDALGNDLGFSAKDIVDYRRGRSFTDIVEFHQMFFNLLGRGEPERVSTGVVSANYFDVLGVQPLLGRTFVAPDEAPGAPAVLVLSHQYWERSFGGVDHHRPCLDERGPTPSSGICRCRSIRSTSTSTCRRRRARSDRTRRPSTRARRGCSRPSPASARKRRRRSRRRTSTSSRRSSPGSTPRTIRKRASARSASR